MDVRETMPDWTKSKWIDWTGDGSRSRARKLVEELIWVTEWDAQANVLDDAPEQQKLPTRRLE